MPPFWLVQSAKAMHFSGKRLSRPISFGSFLLLSSWCNAAVKPPIHNFSNYPSISTLEPGCCTQLQSCSRPGSRKVLRTTVLVGKLPVSPVHSAPMGPFRIPGHQCFASPLSFLYLPPDDHRYYNCVSVCLCVGWKYVDLGQEVTLILFTAYKYCQTPCRIHAQHLLCSCLSQNKCSCVGVCTFILTVNTLWMHAISITVCITRAVRKTWFPRASYLFCSHL